MVGIVCLCVCESEWWVWKQGNQEAIIVISTRCCRLDWCGDCADVKCMGLACVLEVKLIGLANELTKNKSSYIC